jgi:hypothetical protein
VGVHKGCPAIHLRTIDCVDWLNAENPFFLYLYQRVGYRVFHPCDPVSISSGLPNINRIWNGTIGPIPDEKKASNEKVWVLPFPDRYIGPRRWITHRQEREGIKNEYRVANILVWAVYYREGFSFSQHSNISEERSAVADGGINTSHFLLMIWSFCPSWPSQWKWWSMVESTIMK